MVQFWAIKNNWSIGNEEPVMHRIVKTIGPYHISACGIVAKEDSVHGWSEIEKTEDGTIPKLKSNRRPIKARICGKCVQNKER